VTRGQGEKRHEQKAGFEPPSRTAANGPQRACWPRCARALRWRPNDLLRDLVYRRLWASVLTSSFGAQIMMLALPLTAAVLLHASPTQMGALTTMELLPFVLFSLPSGVWLDRVRKLPVYIAGEITLASPRPASRSPGGCTR
jgi:hypothetical protein